jgi:hypothetical protein
MITHDEMVRNIIDAWNALSPEDVAKGHAWYSIAHDIAADIGNGDVRKGAGIIAALSPLKSWAENIRLATDAGNGNVHGHFTSAVTKAKAIMDGTDPETVLPMDAKTGNFFLNILFPDLDGPVTIDRHAWRVATGEAIPSMTPKRYRMASDAYRSAGQALGVPAHIVQAGTWGPMARVGW